MHSSGQERVYRISKRPKHVKAYPNGWQHQSNRTTVCNVLEISGAGRFYLLVWKSDVRPSPTSELAVGQCRCIPTAATHHRCLRTTQTSEPREACVASAGSHVAIFPWIRVYSLGHLTALQKCVAKSFWEQRLTSPSEVKASWDPKESGDLARHAPRVQGTVERGVSSTVPRPLRHGGRQSPPLSTSSTSACTQLRSEKATL